MKDASTTMTMEMARTAELDGLTRAALDFALPRVLSYLDHGEVRARCGLVSREWSAAASETSRCDGRLGQDMSFAFELLDLVVDDSFGLCYSKPGSFELRDLDDVVLFEPHLPLRRLWKCQDTSTSVLGRSPRFAAEIVLNQDTAQALSIDVDDLVEGQDLGEMAGLTLSEALRGEGSANVRASVIRATESDSGGNNLCLELIFDFSPDEWFEFADILYDNDVTVVGKDHEKLWARYQSQPAREGVVVADGDVPAHVSAALRDGIARLAARPHRDYHPGSNNIVRDHVHPGLFPFVKGESKFHPSTDLPTPEPRFLKKWPVPRMNEGSEDEEGSEKIAKDRWGRTYEESVYQWLPTYFDVSPTGRVAIRGEINNLRPREAHAGLYEALEGLFQAFLPELAAVVAYADSIHFIDEDADDDEAEISQDESLKLMHQLVRDDLRGRSLQVITKIVDYELEPGQTHEGVWHVEGMSHEHIVATCLHVVDRDDCVTGGDLLFKRAFTQLERNAIFWNVSQERDQASEQLFNQGQVPLGCQPTPAGRRLCWPNSHIHKVTPMQNIGDKPGKRCIVAFFVVDPCVRIASTQEIGDQTETMGLDKALSHRLRLMEERKRHKQDWNVRDLSLCEH